MEGKLLRRLTFNPGLTLTGFRTTRPRMIDTGHEKGKSLDHTRERTFKQLGDETLKMLGEDQEKAKCSEGFIFNLFSLLIMFVMLFLFSRQQLVTQRSMSCIK